MNVRKKSAFLGFLLPFSLSNNLIAMRGFRPLLRTLGVGSGRGVRPVSTDRAHFPAQNDIRGRRFFLRSFDKARCCRKPDTKGTEWTEIIKAAQLPFGLLQMHYTGCTFSARGPFGPSPSS